MRLYDRSAPTVPVATLDFNVDDPETPAREDGNLEGGSRFLPLTAPLTLPAGFQGIIVANGYGDGERNGNLATGQPWTVDDNGGILSFSGALSYWGSGDPFGYPDMRDTPSGQYAAGTFQYAANGVVRPAPPELSVTGSNGQVKLVWNAIPLPVAAANYRISRSATVDGSFSQITQTAALEFTDTGLTNGTTYFYKVHAVTSDGLLSADGRVYRGTPYQLAASRHIAYFTPSNAIGNQAFSGTLGLDFDVQNPVKVTRLGVFDSGSDGIRPDPGPDGITGTDDDTPRILTARLYDRDNFAEPLASAEFSAEDPGTLLGGMRFKDLAEPVVLSTGFHGCMVADSYGAGEPLLNSSNIPANAIWILDDGQSSLQFTGTGRYGVAQGGFPDTVDGSLAAAYAAGTFEYETTASVTPGRPVVRITPLISDASANLVWEAVTAPAAAAKYRVYRYDPDTLEYTLIGESTSLGYRVSGLVNEQPATFVVRAVSAGGVEGLPSDMLTTIPSVPAAGAAYAVPEGTFGNQSFGGSLGMDFDVANPVKVTKLGAFDSGADGLLVPITVAIYDRTTGTPVTPLMEFPVDDGSTPTREDGELLESSRFLPLNPPVVLPEGFQGSIVAYGYGVDEQNGNAGGGDWTTFSGGSLVFTGTSRWDTALDVLPVNIDGGPANRYAAGTFYFEPAATGVIVFDANLAISLQTGNQARISWTVTEGAVLQRSPDLKTWTAVPGAAPGFITPVSGREFFRLAKP
ncbi:MAG: autotransporter-associated beta strand repeat protein [Verrucomicrobiales bacterium]|nr:autotransporter-associated beta strand repeat protein [Verrucomicrobiales bacterium]